MAYLTVDSSLSSGSGSGSKSTSGSTSERSTHNVAFRQAGPDTPGVRRTQYRLYWAKGLGVYGFLIEVVGETREGGDDLPAQSNGSEASEKVSVTDSVDAVFAPLPTTCSFYLVRLK